MKKQITVLFSAVTALCLLAGCAAGPSASQPETSQPGADSSQTQQAELQRFSAPFYDVFDTVTTVIAYSESREEFDRQMDALHEDLMAYHQLFDIYNEYPDLVNLATVNRTAAEGPVKVDERIMALLVEAKQQYQVTQGQTNVAMGSVLRLWHDARDAAVDGISTPPDPADLEAANAHTSMDDLILDEEAGTVYFADPELKLDVGSCGKGYACEMAARNAEARGLTSAILSVGGNLRAIGEKPGNLPWTGGVENPEKPQEEIKAAVRLPHNYAMVTSGDYQRFFTDAQGVKYHHLIDPETLQPANFTSSVTVITPDSGLADCLSTGLFCMDPAEGLALVETIPNTEAFWCLPDGTTMQSSGFADLML